MVLVIVLTAIFFLCGFGFGKSLALAIVATFIVWLLFG